MGSAAPRARPTRRTQRRSRRSSASPASPDAWPSTPRATWRAGRAGRATGRSAGWPARSARRASSSATRSTTRRRRCCCVSSAAAAAARSAGCGPAERGLVAVVDRTNADLRFVRTRVRRLLVPLLEAEFNPRLTSALAALAARLRDEDDFLAEAAGARSAVLVRDGDLRVAVAAEPPALARRIVRRWLE